MRVHYTNNEGPYLLLNKSDLDKIEQGELEAGILVRNEINQSIPRTLRLSVFPHHSPELVHTEFFPEQILARNATHYELQIKPECLERLRTGKRVSASFGFKDVFIKKEDRNYSGKQEPL